MASKLDDIVSPAEQSAWLVAPSLDESMGQRAAPVLADDPYDDRLRKLLLSEEWPAFAGFLRGYIENGVLRPFETQPGENRPGWWNITIEEEARRVHVNIWRQYAAEIDFRFDEKGELRAFGAVWVDRQTTEEANADVTALPATFAVEPTSLKGRERELVMLVMRASTFDETAEVFNLPWVIRAIRVANLDLMRAGQLSFGWQKFHIAKLVDAVFSEPPTSEDASEIARILEAAIPDESLRTEIEAMIWRRANTHLFARPVLQRAGSKCIVSGVEAVELLQACHIKPWAEADDRERLDPINGLCLAAHVHAAFDAHLLGIEPDGSVVYSDSLSVEDRARLNLISGAHIHVQPAQRPYLEYRFAQYEKRHSKT